ASDLGHGVVWLQPDPGEPFRALTRAIWAAFPEAPPYGSPDIDLEPHLTIASDDPAHFDDVESASAVHVPFRRLVTDVILIVEGPQGRWRTEHRFRLG
ncbi:MAG: 2'-5' RNA ligase family protein, partial [Chloroflexota bacterium]